MEIETNNEVLLRKDALQLKIEAEFLAIENQVQYNLAGEFLLMVQVRKKSINEWFDPLVKSAYAAHKTIKDKQNETLKPALEAESIIKNRMKNYIISQDALQAEEQKKLDMDAEKKRKEFEEKSRIAAEQGKESKAEQYQQKAQESVAPIVAPSVEKTVHTENGTTSIRRKTEITILNKTTILQEILAGRVPETVIDISESMLVKWIDAAGIKSCPGLSIKFDVPQISGRINPGMK